MDVAAGPSEGLPLDADGVVAVNPFQLRGSGALGDSRELLELNLLLPGGDKGQVLDLRCLGPVELVELDSDGVLVGPLLVFGIIVPRESRLERGTYLPQAETEGGHLFPVDLDAGFGVSILGREADIRGPWNGADHPLDGFCRLLHLLQIGSVDSYVNRRHLGASQDSDGVDSDLDAGNLGDPPLDVEDDVVGGAAPSPLIHEGHADLRVVVGALADETVAGGADVGEDLCDLGDLGDLLLHDQGLLVRLCQLRSRLKFQSDGELSSIGHFHELRADEAEGDKGEGEEEKAQGERSHALGMADAPLQQSAVVLGEGVVPLLEPESEAPHEACRGGVLELGEPRRQEGSDREGDKEAEESGNDHDDAVLPDQVADDSRDQGEGEEDRHVHHGDRDGRETYLAPSIQGRGTAVLPHLQVAVDVLENDDGVVHQDPDHQRHGQEGHQVQGEVEEVHGREGRDQGAGDGDHDDQGVADAVEEDQHDQGDQDDGEQEVFLDGVGRVEGEGGAVLGDGELQADLGVVPFKLLKGVTDSLADIDGVGIGLLLNQNPHRRLSVEAADVDGLLDRVLNLRNVAQADIPALSPSDDQVTQFVEALEAAGDPDDELSVDVLDLPCREVQVSGIDRLNDL